MTATTKFPLKLIVGLALAIALDTGAQLLWKAGVTGVPEMPSLWLTAQAMLRQPLFLGVAVLMVGQFLNWMMVLDHADLSYAHSITSLSYVSVAALSVFVLGESLDPAQIAGIALILVGVWFIGKSGHVGAPPPVEGLR